MTGEADTKKSISAEYRGYPCQETANAPTTRYSTPFEFKHSTNSRKSLLSGIGVGSFPDREKNFDPFLRAHFASRKSIGCIRLFKAVKDADYFLHPYILPRCEVAGEMTVAKSWGQNSEITVGKERRSEP